MLNEIKGKSGKMKNLTSKQKISLLGFVLYTVIIGIGMFTSYHVNGNDYGSPELVNTLWFFEIILTVLTVYIVTKYFSWKEIGFQKLDKKQFLWFLPSSLIIIFMWGGLLQHLFSISITNNQLMLFSLVGFTTLLVGFSEELMFRGIVLHAFLKTSSKRKAVFISALTFSLIHAVNIFGGVSTLGVPIQLILTFIFGLFFGFLQLRIKNIIPLMIFHWLWDFFLIGGSIFSYEEAFPFSTVHLLVELVLVVVLLVLLRKRDR